MTANQTGITFRDKLGNGQRLAGADWRLGKNDLACRQVS